tara:strand:+ start:53963 stop:54682 length:720 start_codon:yes stop_codon:yes gene_type:complete
MLPSFKQIFMAITVLSLPFFLSLPAVAGNDCVDCSVQSDAPGSRALEFIENLEKIGMMAINCPDGSRSFEEDFCDSYMYVKNKQNFDDWIKKCGFENDPNRDDILDYFEQFSCENYRSLAYRNTHPDLMRTQRIPAASFLHYSGTGIHDLYNYHKELVLYYLREDRENLDRFVNVLNRRDGNGFTFLDHLNMKWVYGKDEVKNTTRMMINTLCSVGANFSDESLNERFDCKPNPRILGS